MLNKIFYLSLLFVLCVSVNAQVMNPQPIYRSNTGRERPQEEQQLMREIYRNEIQNLQFNQLRNFADRNRPRDNKPDYSYTTVIDTLPKDVTDKAKKFIVTDEALKLQNKSFLKLPDTGIVKMMPDKICQVESSQTKKGFYERMEQCPHKFINGNGKYFSFRQKDYVVSRLADIGIRNNLIFSLGLFNQGIMVNIGDVPLEQVSLSTKGADYLGKISSSAEIREIDARYKEFESGVTNENLIYQKILPLELNKTYVLRVTAYNVDWSQEQPTSTGSIKTYPLKEDKRKDILVAFRAVSQDDQGNTTLIWKELQSKNAPKLEIPK